MSFVPAFKIGLWNAWIIEVLGLLTFLPTLMSKEAMKKRSEGEPAWSEFSKTDKAVFLITHPIILPFTLIYSIFLPLKVGTIWFYVGIPISILAIVMGFMAGISFASGPFDKPMTGGIYRISRHPWYFAWFLMFVGIGIACASWVFLLCAVVWIISWNIGVVSEERVCLEKYGDAYREYMNRTPRWIGIPKSGEE
jgi:protein-S-isoprenylcysteine O-methyltransferase Ste14